MEEEGINTAEQYLQKIHNKYPERAQLYRANIFDVMNVSYESRLAEVQEELTGLVNLGKHFGKDSDKILKFTDLPVVLESINKLLKYNIFEKRKLSFDEIESHIEQGHVPLMLIDHNKIVGKEGLYQGHFVVVTGYDDQNVFYHESGPKNPEANKKVLKSTFIDSWNANGTDNDAVIVYGK